MSNFAAIRDAIHDILAGVSGIGQVHNRLRWSIDTTKFKAMFSAAGKINGWTITRTATPESRDTVGENQRHYQFTIEGYYSFEDSDTPAQSSEQILQALVESICDAFRPNPTINDLGFTFEPVQVVMIEPRKFATFLVHYVKLSVEVIDPLPT